MISPKLNKEKDNIYLIRLKKIQKIITHPFSALAKRLDVGANKIALNLLGA